MRVDAFSYDLPPELIAQRPTEDRDGARLLDLRGEQAILSRSVAELAELLPEGALVVVNDTRVIPARLIGKKRETGGKVEIFLVRRLGTRTIALEPTRARDGESVESVEEEPGASEEREVDVWRALGKSTKALRFGTDVDVGPLLCARLLGRADEDGLLEVALWTRDPAAGSVEDAIRATGHVPLPPYIKRDDDAEDSHRYQTIFARVDGAIAAPTAGLHITRALLGRLAVRGCEIASVTLHVGLGTFQPVTAEDFDQHRMHTESFAISRATAAAIAGARSRGAPVVAVGTTVVRALESAADPDHDGHVLATSGDTRLLIQPGHRFRVVDLLLTNFHLPRSTLLALVCAFGGTDRVLDAYRRAVAERLRFFSYGDAMLVARSRAHA